MQTPVRRIVVLTGDASLPDPTKREGRYHDEDRVTHEAMVAAFRSLGDYEFRFWGEHNGLLERLREDPPDLVVNFCDTGFRNQPTRELNLPAYLEMLDIPYTGSPPAAMVMCYDKAVVRLVAESLNVPVPREHYLSAGATLDAWPDRYPALLKPNTADGSVGITKDAVVATPAAARDYLDWLRRALPHTDVLIQEYLPGPEYGIGLIGNPPRGFRALPALEVDFSGLPAGFNPILSYESKAIPDSPYWTDIKVRRGRLPEDQEQRMADSARRLFTRLGLRDYGRFDFRTAADGEPKLMEVNPNPAWANDAKLAAMASFAGLQYRDLLRLILDTAIARVTGERQ